MEEERGEREREGGSERDNGMKLREERERVKREVNDGTTNYRDEVACVREKGLIVKERDEGIVDYWQILYGK